jgi:hypothetical protein
MHGYRRIGRGRVVMIRKNDVTQAEDKASKKRSVAANKSIRKSALMKQKEDRAEALERRQKLEVSREKYDDEEEEEPIILTGPKRRRSKMVDARPLKKS